MITLFNKEDFKELLGDSFEDMQISGIDVDILFESFRNLSTGEVELDFHDLERLIRGVRVSARRVVFEDMLPGGLK